MTVLNLIPYGEDAAIIFDEEMLRHLGNPAIGDTIEATVSADRKALYLSKIVRTENA